MNLIEDFKDYDAGMEIKLRELKEYAGKIGKDVDDTNERLNQFKDLI